MLTVLLPLEKENDFLAFNSWYPFLVAKCRSFRNQVIAALFFAAADIWIQRQSFVLMSKASRPFLRWTNDVTEDSVLLA